MRSVLLAALALSLAACGAPAPSGLGAGSSRLKAQGVAGFLDLSGHPASLSQELGHPVVLSFLSPSDWNSGAELPQLIRLASAYQSDGVQFIVVGENATDEQLVGWSQDNQLAFPVWQDPTGAELADRGFQAVPATQFLDRGGAVVSSEAGFLSRGQLLAGIAQID